MNPHDTLFAPREAGIAHPAAVRARGRGSVAKKIQQELLEEARAEGRSEGRAAMLRGLLITRFAPLSQRTEQRLHRASPAELGRWAERVLTVGSLRELFAEDRA